MHANPNCAKFPPLASQGGQEIRTALAHDRRTRPCLAGQRQFGAIGGHHADTLRERPGQGTANVGGQRIQMPAALFPMLQRRIGTEDLVERPWRRHRTVRTAGLPVSDGKPAAGVPGESN